MGINEPLFDAIYRECLQIINESTDKNILSKQRKLEASYRELCRLKDHELQEFYSVVHELRLYDYVKRLGIAITARNDNHAGPDFLSDLGYIECVCLTKGATGTPQRQWVNQRLGGSMNRYKSASHRLTSVILDKQKKFSDYLNKNVIDKNRPRIIAVNTSIFSNEFCGDLNLELALKVLYGIGCLQMCFDPKVNAFVEAKGTATHAFEDTDIKPLSNVELHLNYFSQTEFQNISAVILVNNSIGEKLKKDYFNMLLNPYSDTPLNINLLSGISYFALSSVENGYNNYQWYN